MRTWEGCDDVTEVLMKFTEDMLKILITLSYKDAMKIANLLKEKHMFALAKTVRTQVEATRWAIDGKVINGAACSIPPQTKQ